MLTEIEKLAAVRAVGLPSGLFSDMTSRVLEDQALKRLADVVACLVVSEV